MPAAFWILWAIAGLLVLASLVRRPRRAPARHQHVTFRALWWRRYAPPEAVRREIAPLEIQLSDLAPLLDLFPDYDPDAEEDGLCQTLTAP